MTQTPTTTTTATPTDTPTAQPDGADCDANIQCESTFCVEGICCETACDEANQSCVPDGICRDTAPAPALSGQGLLVSLLVLLGIAALAIGRGAVRPRG